MVTVTIDEKYCKGCLLCVDACKSKVLIKSDKINEMGAYIPEVTQEKCTKCRLCELRCPDFAVLVEED
jgi:2-oxoglutarate ferredoxin oxidoreductase subunit delta